MRISQVKTITSAALLFAAAVFAQPAWAAPDTVVAKVNGADITEAELSFAEAEIGSELTGVPAESRRRVLVEYLAEAHLMAEGADKAQLGAGAEFDARMKYYRLRALRDTFFEKKVRDAVTADAAKTIYDDRIKSIPVQQEVRARHILVKTEEEAKKIAKELEGGAEFAELAKKYSQDGGGEGGGDLGYFTAGQMVKQFEEIAFATEKGKVSAPVQTKYGWHLIKIEDKRDRKLPNFDEVKDQIVTSLVQSKLQSTVREMRTAAKIEMVDPELKKAVEAEAAAAAAKNAPAAEPEKKEADKKEPEKK
jgi:peptidyl-prolyl cis-trans isomerase C